PLLEGYGATECSPVVAVNQPTDNRPGTVGRLLPGIETRLDPVEGITDGCLLNVRGPNVLAGYLLDPDTVERPDGGWYDTGDVVSIDAEGLVRLKGRVKRFAKIGGEMVSLTAVEELAAGALGGARCAAVALADPRKGERLVLFTEHPGPEAGAIAAYAKSQGAPELAVPRRVVPVEAIPVLGTGKIDYPALQRLAEDEGQAAA
ncbi:MAG: AMP-binding protein, partial [Pseudomonadota bacterium]|nr:AMP-binding protein [Pseudomonadota bacterium]